jgi:signal transduction histidine kinase
MIALLGLFMTTLTKTKLNISITATIISTGMSYAILTLSAVISIFLYVHFLQSIISEKYAELFFSISTFFIEGLLANIPFRFSRLKRGFTFLNKRGAGSLGIFIGTILLCCAIILGQPTGEESSLIVIMSALGILICLVGIISFWRSGIKKSYLEYLQAQELEELRAQIAEKEEQIEELMKHNEQLSSIIHRDNKLIPAMELAVRECISSSEQNSEQAIKRTAILAQLADETAERSGLISTYQINNKKLPSTKVFEIDNLLRYLQNKAAEEQVMFDLIIACDVKYMTTELLDQSKMRTILADLIENAIIAVRTCKYKSILVSIVLIEGFYTISIEDSGVDFQIETLCNLGLEKATTHADDGGSGIGLFSTFEIMKLLNASLIINENKKIKHSFTKKITIRFDGKSEYIVNTKRVAEIANAAQRSDMILNDILQ